MGLLDDILEDDAAAFTDTDGFGESVTYTNRAGTTRTINAVVTRLPPKPGPGGTLVPNLRIEVANSTTTGIATSEWKNGDTVTVAERRGGSTRAFQVHFPDDEAGAHDAGMVTYELS